MSSHIVVFMTASSMDEAAGVARSMVEARLVACCNIIPQIRSIYHWQGQIHDEPEVMMVAKTRQEMLPAIIEKVRSMHSYDVPEIVAVPMAGALDSYLSWIDANVAGPKSARAEQ